MGHEIDLQEVTHYTFLVMRVMREHEPKGEMKKKEKRDQITVIRKTYITYKYIEKERYNDLCSHQTRG